MQILGECVCAWERERGHIGEIKENKKKLQHSTYACAPHNIIDDIYTIWKSVYVSSKDFVAFSILVSLLSWCLFLAFLPFISWSLPLLTVIFPSIFVRMLLFSLSLSLRWSHTNVYLMLKRFCFWHMLKNFTKLIRVVNLLHKLIRVTILMRKKNMGCDFSCVCA